MLNFIFADGYVIGHYANNARDFLYPAVPPYPGSGREVTLFKTSLFNPIRITVSNTNQCHSFMLLKSMLFVNCMGAIWAINVWHKIFSQKSQNVHR